MKNNGLEKLSGIVREKGWLEDLHKSVINPDVDQRVVVSQLGERLLAQVRASLSPSFEADIKRTAKVLSDAKEQVDQLKNELTHHLAIGQAQRPRAEVEAWVVRRLALEHSLPIYESLVAPAEDAHAAAIEKMRSALRAALQPLADTTIDGVEHARRDAHGHERLAVRVGEGVSEAAGLIDKSEKWMV